MSKKYTSKYPAVIIDKHPNSAIDKMQKKITVEEYYDIMHHTHNISDLIAVGDINYESLVKKMNELLGVVGGYKTIIEEQQKSINNSFCFVFFPKTFLKNIFTMTNFIR